MPLYKIDKQKANHLQLKRNGFGNEFALRDFFADNLYELLGVRFIEKEYSIPDGRIDTLGIDENNAPVIIEYKWKENEEVLSQGLFYLDWLLKNKKHFELLVQSKFGAGIEVSWYKPRVILIAQGFNRYIKSAVQRVEHVELKSYALYEGDILQIENEFGQHVEKEKVPVERNDNQDKPEFNLEYHLNKTSEKMKEAFYNLRERILLLPSVEENAEQKSGITYRTTKSFTRLEFKGNWIELLLRDPSYMEDDNHLIKDVTSFGWGYKGSFKFTPDTSIDYLFMLVEASYKSTL